MATDDKYFDFDDALQEAAEKWAHPALVKIWVICSTPSFTDDSGEGMLGEDDIEEIGRCVIELNNAFNQPEIKAICQRQTAQQAFAAEAEAPGSTPQGTG